LWRGQNEECKARLDQVCLSQLSRQANGTRSQKPACISQDLVQSKVRLQHRSSKDAATAHQGGSKGGSTSCGELPDRHTGCSPCLVAIDIERCVKLGQRQALRTTASAARGKTHALPHTRARDRQNSFPAAMNCKPARNAVRLAQCHIEYDGTEKS